MWFSSIYLYPRPPLNSDHTGQIYTERATVNYASSDSIQCHHDTTPSMGWAYWTPHDYLYELLWKLS
jgi:hypothetical protein